MLYLDHILWVIPGFIFISIYNRRRPERNIILSGWEYVFSLVIMASITWVPSELIVSTSIVWEWIRINLPITDMDQEKVRIVIVSVISIALSLFWLLVIQWKFISDIVFPPILDNFYKKCIQWENEEILFTLKSGKAYHGLLWKYPENPKSRHESQTISIVPFKSGYRDNKTKTLLWNTYYPKYKKDSDLVDMEIIIPRSEIVTFGKFSNQAFKYFEQTTKKLTKHK